MAPPPQPTAHHEDTDAPDDNSTGASVSSGPPSPQRVIASMRSGLRRCYQAALAISPDLDVKLSVRIRIDANGTPTLLEIASTDRPPQSFVTCIQSRVEQAAFSPPDDGTPATHVIPLIFRKD